MPRTRSPFESVPGRHADQQGRPVRRRDRRARWWPLLALFFQKTATGRALRAVADDHQAAQSIGIPLGRIWVIVWASPASWRWWPG